MDLKRLLQGNHGKVEKPAAYAKAQVCSISRDAVSVVCSLRITSCTLRCSLGNAGHPSGLHHPPSIMDRIGSWQSEEGISNGMPLLHAASWRRCRRRGLPLGRAQLQFTRHLARDQITRDHRGDDVSGRKAEPLGQQVDAVLGQGSLLVRVLFAFGDLMAHLTRMLAIEGFLDALYEALLRRVALDHLCPGHHLQYTPVRPDGYHQGDDQEKPCGRFHRQQEVEAT